jgi:hypothetical protein
LQVKPINHDWTPSEEEQAKNLQELKLLEEEEHRLPQEIKQRGL